MQDLAELAGEGFPDRRGGPSERKRCGEAGRRSRREDIEQLWDLLVGSPRPSPGRPPEEEIRGPEPRRPADDIAMVPVD